MSEKKNHAQPEAVLPKRPIGQTILVILLIAAVAIIFGVGPGTLNMALGGSQVQELADGITNVDVARHQRVNTVLKMIQMGKKPHEMSDDEWSQSERQIQQYAYYFGEPSAGQVLMGANLAEKDGMMPSGKALNIVVKKFLSEVLRDGSTMFAAIREVQREATSVDRTFSRKELDQYLAAKRANENIENRYNPRLVAVDSMGQVFYNKSKERVYVQEARLSTAAILPEFKAIVTKDQDLLTATYETHKSLERFKIPRKVHLTVFSADSTVIAASVVISDEAIGTWYKENKETDANLRIVTEPVVEKESDKDTDKVAEKTTEKVIEEVEVKTAEKKEAVITYKSLEESKAYIRGKLEIETSTQILSELCQKFVQVIEESDLLEESLLIEGKEAEMITLVQGISIPATDVRLTADVHFTVWIDVTGDDPDIENDVQLLDNKGAPLARLSQAGPLYLFNGKRGNIGFPQAATDRSSMKLLVITNLIDPASNKELEDVKDEVIMLAAVEKAYPELVKRAEALQLELNKVADQDLTVFFAVPERATWAAEVTDKDYAPLDVMVTPEGAQNLDELPIIAYTQPGKQYVLVSDDDDGEMKRVKLIKIIRHEIKEDAGMNLRSSRDLYIRAVTKVSGRIFNDELQKQKNL